MRRRTVLAATGIAVVLLVAGSAAAVAVTRDTGFTVHTESGMLPGVPEAGLPVSLDATLYTPVGAAPAPAVMLAHGFGGSKNDLDADARLLTRRGYVVLTWTARGFGNSGGLIHLDSPDDEVADASRLVDYLATRSEVLKDGPTDPRVGVAGGSYGGAIALMLAGYDRRIDAIAPQITWNDLRQALFQQSVVAPGTAASPADLPPVGPPGVFKRSWAGVFFGPGGSGGDSTTQQQQKPLGSLSCGRFAPDLCAYYQSAAATGRPSQAMLDRLWASSPARILSRITAPTLLVQGEADSLFPLSEGDANARGIAAAGTPVKVVWEGGGHDGGIDETDRLRQLTAAWFDRYLKRDGSPPDTRFEVTVPAATISSADSNPAPQIRVSVGEPGVSQNTQLAQRQIPLTGAPQSVVAPAGGSPAAVSSLPGLGSALTQAAGAAGLGSLSRLPGQAAVFTSATLTATQQIVGASSVRLHVTSTTGDATLFASMRDVAPAGQDSLPEGLVSPLYLRDLPPTGTDVTVRLPAVVLDVAAGHRLQVVVSTTDQAYALPADPRQYQLALAGDAQLTVPVVDTTVLATGGVQGLLPWALALLGVVLLLALFAWWRRGRTGRVRPDPALAEVPLAIEGLGKAYGDGYRAVSELSFRVEKGWVLGLLGPNGAGKTTTLRMLMGLIMPTEGEIRVFGHRIAPGAPVLSRVGAFVEGPGFLPHVSGLDNLRLYWRATGRPMAQARLEEALEVAGLGEDVHRKVKKYSQGMRQRLAIAQAMLGLPDLLVMDEPTNGLDPPQIREMREVLSRYAATGRTVVVSSHQLAEVEQTCTHVVVMHQGRLVAQGPVAELVGTAISLVVDVDDPERAAQVAATVDGARDIEVTSSGLVLKLVGTPRGDLVRALVGAGLQIERVAPQHGLEEAFLALVGEA